MLHLVRAACGAAPAAAHAPRTSHTELSFLLTYKRVVWQQRGHTMQIRLNIENYEFNQIINKSDHDVYGRTVICQFQS